MKKVFIVSLLLVALLYAKNQQESDALAIIQKIDKLYRHKTSYAKIKMEIVTPHWQRTLLMKSWSKGQKKTFIRILEPKKEKGVSTLRIGNEMWNYLPRTNKVIKIPPSMMMSSWMGSDFTNDDLVKEFTFEADYRFSFTEIEKPEANELYIKCIPKEGRPIIWGKVILAVDKNNYYPIWQKYYDEKGKLMRVLEYSNLQNFDGYKIPAKMVLIPQNKEGHKTIIHYLEAKFNQDIDDEIFSLRNLRK